MHAPRQLFQMAEMKAVFSSRVFMSASFCKFHRRQIVTAFTQSE
jgi:hypothetical protein